MRDGYYRPIKTKKLIALLVRHGFISVGGTKHGKYVRAANEQVIIVPRHRTITSGTAKQICTSLEKEFNIPRSEIKKLF